MTAATTRFDDLTEDEAVATLLACCASPQWAARIAAARPYADLGALLEYADTVLTNLPDSEIDAALAGHPRIGDRPDNAASAREQSAVTDADRAVLADLREANEQYERTFGHVYLVCASGRTAEELLAVLRTRLGHDAATERLILRDDLVKITRLRLTRMATDDEFLPDPDRKQT